MHFSSYLSFGLLASLVKTAPTANKTTNLSIASTNIQSSVLLHNTSHSTTTKIPSYCSFPANEFYYLPFTYYGRNACIGIDTFDESPGAWSPAEYENIYAAMNQQVTKDGLWKTSQLGCWVANFEEFTSAIPDREGYTSAFRWAVETGNGLKGAGFKRFYFQLDGQYTVVRRLALC